MYQLLEAYTAYTTTKEKMTPTAITICNFLDAHHMWRETRVLTRLNSLAFKLHTHAQNHPGQRESHAATHTHTHTYTHTNTYTYTHTRAGAHTTHLSSSLFPSNAERCSVLAMASSVTTLVERDNVGDNRRDNHNETR